MLVVGGAVSHQDIFQKAKEIFGDWKPSDFDPFQKWPIPEFPPLRPADSLSFVVTNANARVPILFVGWHGPDTRNDIKNTVVADVFSFILSEKSSDFQKSLIDSGYALVANLNYQSAKYVGAITLQYVPNPAKFSQSFRALQKQLDRFDDSNYFTDEQLEISKLKLANSEIYGEEVTSNYVHTLSFWWASASLDYYFNYVKEIKKVTRQDIIAYVDKYIKGQPCVKGLLLNNTMQENWKVNDLDGLFK